MPQRIPAHPQPIHGLSLARPQPVAGDQAPVLPDGAGDDETHAGDEAQYGVHGAPPPEDLQRDRPRPGADHVQAYHLPGGKEGGAVRRDARDQGLRPRGAHRQAGGQEAAGQRQDGEEAGRRQGLLLLQVPGVQAGVRSARRSGS